MAIAVHVLSFSLKSNCLKIHCIILVQQKTSTSISGGVNVVWSTVHRLS